MRWATTTNTSRWLIPRETSSMSADPTMTITADNLAGRRIASGRSVAPAVCPSHPLHTAFHHRTTGTRTAAYSTFPANPTIRLAISSPWCRQGGADGDPRPQMLESVPLALWPDGNREEAKQVDPVLHDRRRGVPRPRGRVPSTAPSGAQCAAHNGSNPRRRRGRGRRVEPLALGGGRRGGRRHSTAHPSAWGLLDLPRFHGQILDWVA